MRSISNIVDITNYVMLETGQPLHAFDYAVLRRRAGSLPAPVITTRLPAPGETIATLDGAQRKLDDFTVLVADSAGALSIGGVMGGGESEVSAATEHVLLEAASWNFTNIRRTVQAQQLHSSQAGYRFSRGVHPAMAPLANLRAAALMQQLAGGSISTELCDVYPQPLVAPVNRLPLAEVQRHLGLQIPKPEIMRILRALEFAVEDAGSELVVTAPDHRLDIGTGAEGIADLVEEVARIYGYERMPETQISDTTPPQRANPALEHEERVRDLLAGLGVQEVITYRLTAPEREQRLLPPGVPQSAPDYVTLLNPVAAERTVLRRALLASVLEVAEANARFQQRLALFEIGPVFLPVAGAALPLEQRRLALVLWGPRAQAGWQAADSGAQDFFDMKGLVELLLESLRVEGVRFESAQHAAMHPGRCAQVFGADALLGTLGELHPQVSAAYSLAEHAVLCADFDLEALLAATPARHATAPLPRFPAVVEDIALLVDEEVAAARVQALIVQTGGAQLAQVQLFDVFRSAQLGAGRKSLAYRLSYQSGEKTLTDAEAAKLRNKIVRRLQQELGATLRDK
jgi:phenylalanyl-tRNA synthetase beta chain